MPPKQSATLTEAELRIMDVLWRKGAGTVQQVLERLTSPLAYNSVVTTIPHPGEKGYLQRVKEGRAHVYDPIVGREELRAPRSGICSDVLPKLT